jgi:cytochrome c553
MDEGRAGAPSLLAGLAARLRAHLRQGVPALLIVAGGLFLGGTIFVLSGVYNVAARSPHWSLTNWLLIVVRDRSIATSAFGVRVPDLADDDLADLGAEHYRSGCAPCHGVPGQGAGPVSRSMLPAPPDLITAYDDYTSAELFWIIYNGLKFTGMPAWAGEGRSDEVWSLVSFLDRLRREGAKPYAARERTPLLPPELEAAGVAAPPMENCARCHGDARSLPLNDRVPRLHGQSEAYLIRSIENYRDGTRQSGIMAPIAHAMSEEESRALAGYYANLPASRSAWRAGMAEDRDLGAVPRGERIARDGVPDAGIPACSSCHGGVSPQFPKLAGQSAAYLRGQLELWQTGVRDRSGYGAIMSVIAGRLNDAQIRDVAAFYASLPPGQPFRYEAAR